MRQDKTFARILLIFSIANVILAAPALLRQRSLVTNRADDKPTGEPEQDPAGSAHQEVVSVASPPPVGSPAGSEKLHPEPGVWTEDSLLEWLSNLSDEDVFEPNSPSDLPKYSKPISWAPPSHDNQPPVLKSLPLQDKPFPWWEHTDWRPPGVWEVGESSRTGSGASEMLPPKLPPASGAQPLHDDAVDTNIYWHDLDSVMDTDQASTMSWASKVSELSEEGGKVAEETHLHP
jgi:hypothetical protein